MQQQQDLSGQMQRLQLENRAAVAGTGAAETGETPELTQFRSLRQETQQLILYDYPRLLATAMHQYSSGADCETVLRQLLEGCPQMLRFPNSHGDSPIAVGLLSKQDERTRWLAQLSNRKNPAALDYRSRYLETLSMLSTSCGISSEFINLCLTRDPTQLYRLYDCDGRNLLHHCALEDSTTALEATLEIAKQSIAAGSVAPANISAALEMNDRAGETPIHLMAARNRSDMLRLLQDFCREAGVGINLDVRRHTGNLWTPLMLASSVGATEAVRLLLDADADPRITDQEEQNAMELAVGRMTDLFAKYFEPEELVAAGHRVEVEAQVQPKQLKPLLQYTSSEPVTSADSGIGSGGSCCSNIANQASENSISDTLCAQEVSKLDEHLRTSGHTEAFFEAMKRRNAKCERDQDQLRLIAEKPLTTAFACWAHTGPPPRSQVIEALESIGEQQAADALRAGH